MSDLDNAENAAAAPAPVILYGLDQAGKTHASRFTAEQAEQAMRAAKMMGMHVLSLAGREPDKLLDTVAAGRIFEKTGSAFVPFVARATFERLAALGGVPISSPAPRPERAPKSPKEAKATKAAAEPQGTPKPARAAAAKATPQPPAAATGVALSWQTIAAGSLVLATTGEVAAGWFEAIVMEEKPDQLFVLRWREWLDEPLILRRVDQIALLPVGTPLVADD